MRLKPLTHALSQIFYSASYNSWCDRPIYGPGGEYTFTLFRIIQCEPFVEIYLSRQPLNTVRIDTLPAIHGVVSNSCRLDAHFASSY